MKKIKLAIFCTLSLFTLASHAGLLNISTNNLQSRTIEASGCAILEKGGPTFQGSKILIVFAESNEANSDSTLVVRDLKGVNSWTNDDWLGNRYVNGNLLGGDAADATLVYRSGVGRTPVRPSDAAILVAFAPGSAICAFSKDKASDTLKSVSISIADITPGIIKSYPFEIDHILKDLLAAK